MRILRKIFGFSVAHFGIVFLITAVLFFVCMLSVAANDEGTGSRILICEIIFNILSAPARAVYWLTGGLIPLLFLWLIGLFIDATIITILFTQIRNVGRKKARN